VIDNIVSKITVLAEGNLGAATCLIAISRRAPDWIDYIIETLDNCGVKGHRIWTMYADVCNQNEEKFIELMARCPEEILITVSTEINREEIKKLVEQYTH
jgi:hypothetical protein